MAATGAAGLKVAVLNRMKRGFMPLCFRLSSSQ